MGGEQRACRIGAAPVRHEIVTGLAGASLDAAAGVGPGPGQRVVSKAEAQAPLAHLPGFGGGAGPEAMIDRQDRQTAGGRLRGEPQQGHRIGSAGDGQRYMRMSRDGDAVNRP